MHAILSLILLLAGVAIPPAFVEAPAASQPAPVVATACGDWLDLVQLFDDPRVETHVVDVWQQGDAVVVVAVHSLGDANDSDCVWVGFYAFPSTIYAHSIVTVPFHADEMD